MDTQHSFPFRIDAVVTGFLLSVFVCTPVWADDTEIFFGTTNSSTSKANVLLLLDTSGSMGGRDGTATTRLTRMQNALRAIIDNTTNANIGLARFTSPGGAIVYPITDVGNVAGSGVVRTELKNVVNAFTANSATPLVTSMLEAAYYFRGENVFYGLNRGGSAQNFKRVSHPKTYTNGSVSPAGCTNSDANSCAKEQISGSPLYTSPINLNCQSNHLVVLSDGVANRGDTTRIEAFIKANNGNVAVTCDTAVPNSGGECGKELAAFLSSYDQSKTYKKSNITTHTIGFANDVLNNPGAKKYLEDIASAGGGLFKTATNGAQLSNVFKDIIKTAANVDTSFVVPGISVNMLNRISNREELYLTLFKPASKKNWPGNFKRYSLKNKGTGTSLQIYDRNNNLAIDSTTNLFKDTARSFWSNKTDGNNTALGGAAEKLTNSRKIYSNLTTTSSSLTSTVNAFNSTNISAADLGAANNTERDDIIAWATGTDNGNPLDSGDYIEATLKGRQQMGAPLHSSPVLISYDDSLNADGTAKSLDITAYFGANDGYLYAIDTATGKELFSFIPKDLLPNLKTLRDNTSNGNPFPVYGVDGSITVWRYDGNKDKKISGSSDRAIIYFGLRRGGNSYYALDVTDRNNPKILWNINNTQTDFAALGQSWSQPVLATIDLATLDLDAVVGGDGATKVLIFGGGYDTAQDSKTVRSADSMGNAIFIVNALSGKLIWSAGGSAATTTFAAMQYSIPSKIAVIDVNGDQVADQMYVGDMGGQLWRFDFQQVDVSASPAQGISDLVVGGVIADINSGSTEIGNRRFYSPPDLAAVKGSISRYMAITIGSGYRAHPLNTTIQDRFYLFKNSNYTSIPSSYTKLTEADLYDATLNIIGQGSTKSERDTANATLAGRSGWYITLGNLGEKILTSSLTFDNKAIFTSYQPEDAMTTTNNECQPKIGTGRVYLVSIFDATPVEKLSDSNLPNLANRSQQLNNSGIPAAPLPVYTKDGGEFIVGTEIVPLSFPDRVKRTYWHNKE